jgi:hypothetical protein
MADKTPDLITNIEHLDTIILTEINSAILQCNESLDPLTELVNDINHKLTDPTYVLYILYQLNQRGYFNQFTNPVRIVVGDTDFSSVNSEIRGFAFTEILVSEEGTLVPLGMNTVATKIFHELKKGNAIEFSFLDMTIPEL